MRQIILVYLFFTIFFVKAQSRYEATPNVDLATLLVDTDDRLNLYLTITSKEARLYNFRFNFYTYVDGEYAYNTRSVDYADSTFIHSQNNEHHILFSFDESSINRQIDVEVFDYLNGSSIVENITTKSASPFTLLSPEGIPVIKPYTNAGLYTASDSADITCYYYDQPFEPGLPPMVTRDDAPPRSMNLVSKFSFTNSVILNERGLYLFQKDTTSAKSYTLRVENDRYPRFTRIQELIQPLMYITELEEYDTLLTIGNDKKRFDQFWLEMVDNPERALNVIREFYKRVEAANRLFTTFKQGWMTDMGMIYIVMGQPDRVQKSGNKETWSYEEDRHLPRRSYQFIKTNTIFSSNHYVLIRERKHAQSWYGAIDLLRKGIF